MRITLKIDEKIAVRLKRLDGFSNFQEAVDAVLQAGLEQLESAKAYPNKPYRMNPVDLGPKISNLDNIAEILDISWEE
ncbi:MAG: hypothetical protein AAFP03_16255 [Cyanobacteria bacterium J06598_3]